MEIYLKYKEVILRTLGVLLLLIGTMMYFFVTPSKTGVSQNDKAAARVARMEASVAGKSKAEKPKSSSEHVMHALKSQQEQQVKYFTILVILLGAASLGYSFIKKKEE